VFEQENIQLRLWRL